MSDPRSSLRRVALAVVRSDLAEQAAELRRWRIDPTHAPGPRRGLFVALTRAAREAARTILALRRKGG